MKQYFRTNIIYPLQVSSVYCALYVCCVLAYSQSSMQYIMLALYN